MLDLNYIYCLDCLDGLKLLDDNSIDVIITSPPYNKAGLNGVKKRSLTNNWISTIDYNGDVNVDNMNEDDYQQWQTNVLNECFRVLKPNGSMFYNHKNRIHNGRIISPYQWLLKTNFIIRQEIIWDRQSTNNVNPCRFLPLTELIFWLTKTNKPNFYRNKDCLFKTEVWSFPFKTHTEHPAPFPVNLPDNILQNIPKLDNEKMVVLDPFMGSGTVALSAIKNGFNYIGFDKFQIYVDMANKNINNFII